MEDLVPQKHGGATKRGNTKNVGRHSNTVRARFIQGSDAFSKYLLKILTGKKCIPILGPNGDIKAYRFPNNQEIMDAGREANKHAMVTRLDVTSDDQPLQGVSLLQLEALSNEEIDARIAAAERGKAS